MKTLLFLLFSLAGFQNLGILLDYEGTRLEEVLIDLEVRHQIHFSYSIDRIDVDRIIHSKIEANNIHDALHQLFQDEQIIYKKVGRQYVLKRMKSYKKAKTNPVEKPDEILITEEENTKKIKHESHVEVEKIEASILSYLKYEPIEVELMMLDTSAIYPSYISSGRTVFLDPNIELDMRGIKLGIISGIDSEALLGDDSEEKNVSFNLFWGETQALKGFELGTIYNTVLSDANGAQISGIGNQINGNLEGVQIGGLLNKVDGNAKGAQISGLVNTVGSEARGIQIAGLYNANGHSNGLVQISGIANRSEGKTYTQISGIFNVNENSNNLVQISGIANNSKAHTSIQITGLSNIGDEVDVQVSGIFNKAKHVGKLQIGLINVADSVDGLSIGIVNIVKKGYNRLELYYDETMYLNAAYRLGSRRFHSIFTVGYSRFDSDYYRWGVGFGFGSRFDFNERSGLNLDLTATHINENDSWENRLNLVNTLALTYSHQIFGKSELFVGPTFNVYISERTNVEGDNYLQNHFLDDYWGTVYDDYDDSRNGNIDDIIMWIGIKAGIRF